MSGPELKNKICPDSRFPDGKVPAFPAQIQADFAVTFIPGRKTVNGP
jgi:hypothetical protein